MESKGFILSTSVRVSVFYTRNLGNFENVKVGYELESDERREGESVEDFRKRLKNKVQTWIVEDLQEIDSDAR